MKLLIGTAVVLLFALLSIFVPTTSALVAQPTDYVVETVNDALVYTVNTNTPINVIAQIVAGLKAGDTLQFLPGVYLNLALDLSGLLGSADAWIIIKGLPSCDGEYPIIKIDTDVLLSANIKLGLGSSFIKIEALLLTQIGSGLVNAVHFLDNVTNVILANLVIDGINGAGIYIADVDNIVNVLIKHNALSNIGLLQVSANLGVGIVVGGLVAPVTNVVNIQIVDNVLHDLFGNVGSAIQVLLGVVSPQVLDNVIWNAPLGLGLDVDLCVALKVVTGIVDGVLSQLPLVARNLIVNTSGLNLGLSVTAAVQVGAGTQLVNNIIVNADIGIDLVLGADLTVFLNTLIAHNTVFNISSVAFQCLEGLGSDSLIIVNNIFAVGEGLLGVVLKLVDGLLGGVAKILNNVVQGLLGIDLTGDLVNLVGVVEDVVDEVVDTVDEVVDTVGDVVEEVVDTVDEVVDTVDEVLTDVVGSLGGSLNGLLSPVEGILGGLIGDVLSIGGSVDGSVDGGVVVDGQTDSGLLGGILGGDDGLLGGLLGGTSSNGGLLGGLLGKRVAMPVRSTRNNFRVRSLDGKRQLDLATGLAFITGNLDQILKGVVTPLGPALNNIVGELSQVVDQVGQVVTDEVLPPVLDALDSIITNLQSAFNEVPLLKPLVPVLGDVKTLLDNLIPQVEDLVDEVIDDVEDVLEDIGDILEDQLIPDLANTLETLGQAVAKILDGLLEVLVGKDGLVTGLLDGVLGLLKGVTLPGLDKKRQTAGGSVDGSGALDLSAVLNGLLGGVLNLGGSGSVDGSAGLDLSGVLDGLLGGVLDLGSAEGLLGGIIGENGLLGGLLGGLSLDDLLGGVLNLGGDGTGLLDLALGNVLSALLGDLNGVLGNVLGAVDPLLGSLLADINGLLDGLLTGLNLDGLLSGLLADINALLCVVLNLVNNLLRALLGNGAANLHPVLGNIVNSIVNVLDHLLGGILSGKIVLTADLELSLKLVLGDLANLLNLVLSPIDKLLADVLGLVDYLGVLRLGRFTIGALQVGLDFDIVLGFKSGVVVVEVPCVIPTPAPACPARRAAIRSN